MKRITTALAAFGTIMLMFVMSSCGGDFASPTTTTTTTTLETTTTTMEASQDNNRPICVGLFNLGSCNVVTVQTQAVHGRTAGSQAPTPQGMSGAELVGTLVLLCVGFVLVMGFAAMVMGGKGYN